MPTAIRWIVLAGIVGAGALALFDVRSAVRRSPAVAAVDDVGFAPGARIVYPAGRRPSLALPDGETRAVISLLNIVRPLKFGDYVWNDRDVPPGPVWMRVDLSRQLISVFRGGHEIGSSVILYGADDKPTPAGVYPVLERARTHRSSIYDADMPYMLRLTGDGVAVHASDVRAYAATHGCIGIPIAFASRVFDQVKRGDLVHIVAAGSDSIHAEHDTRDARGRGSGLKMVTEQVTDTVKGQVTTGT
ncbi:L,D-transpeptidase family protein [uncultured Sphingomonas sp.]|uniref:L,D-transpeptidase family protein n=1 Tax=uncultured Sphingomonas sp. TaxID=158754 RepID=UPI0035C9839F